MNDGFNVGLLIALLIVLAMMTYAVWDSKYFGYIRRADRNRIRRVRNRSNDSHEGDA